MITVGTNDSILLTFEQTKKVLGENCLSSGTLRFFVADEEIKQGDYLTSTENGHEKKTRLFKQTDYEAMLDANIGDYVSAVPTADFEFPNDTPLEKILYSSIVFYMGDYGILRRRIYQPQNFQLVNNFLKSYFDLLVQLLAPKS